jgi:NusA-like KH domain protein
MEELSMAVIKFDDQTIRCITLFENITKTQVKDCLERLGTIYFIVNPGQMRQALGRNGATIRRLRGMFHKNIKIIEYSADIEAFIKNILLDFTIKEIKIDSTPGSGGKKKVAYVSVDVRDKGKIIGRDSRNLKVIREIVNRHSPIDIVIN